MQATYAMPEIDAVREVMRSCQDRGAVVAPVQKNPVGGSRTCAWTSLNARPKGLGRCERFSPPSVLRWYFHRLGDIIVRRRHDAIQQWRMHNAIKLI